MSPIVSPRRRHALLLCVCLAGRLGASTFRDLPADHWAYEAAERLARTGVLQGFGDGTFRGREPVDRYTLAVALVRALDAGIASGASLDGKALGDLEGILTELSEEVTRLGVDGQTLLGELAAERKELETLEARVGRLEEGRAPRRSIEGDFAFDSGEFRLVGFTESANPSFTNLILNFSVSATPRVRGRFGLQYTDVFDGALTDTVDTYEAYLEFEHFGFLVDRLRAGRFNELLGTGLVLFDRVEGFDFFTRRKNLELEILFLGDLMAHVNWPIVPELELGGYYIRQDTNGIGLRPWHIGAYARGGLEGDRVHYGLEYSRYDNGAATPSNLNLKTRAFLGQVRARVDDHLSVELAFTAQQEDFRALSVDNDLAYHSTRSSPLEDILQAILFASGRTLSKNEINGFTDTRLALHYALPESPYSLSLALDLLGSHTDNLPTNEDDELRLLTVALRRELADGSAFEIRFREMRFDESDPSLQAGTLPILRRHRSELRAQYFLPF